MVLRVKTPYILVCGRYQRIERMDILPEFTVRASCAVAHTRRSHNLLKFHVQRKNKFSRTEYVTKEVVSKKYM
jgi:hypothetical protein